MDVFEGDNYLTRALETKTLDEFRVILDSREGRGKLNSRNKDSTTVLMVAAALDNHTAVQLLLKRGAKPDKKTKDVGWNALLIAVRAGSLRSAKVLLTSSNREDINFCSKTGRTAVALAVGNIKMLSWLLQQPGVDPNLCDYRGITPLMLAVRARCLSSAELLIAAGAAVNVEEKFEGLTPLFVLLMTGKREDRDTLAMLKLLLDAGADVGARTRDDAHSILSVAVHLNLPTIARVLIQRGAEIDFQSSIGDVTPLMSAVVVGGRSLEMVHMLLHYGAAPNLRDSHGYSPLMRAAQLGRADIAQVLLEFNADVDARDEEEGVTALMLAAKKDVPEVIQTLLRFKANTRATSYLGHTALMVAVAYGKRKAVKQLLHLSDVDAQNDSGLSALMLATLGDSLRVTKLLLRRGSKANLFLQDHGGNSAATFAALCAGCRILRLLLEEDADVANLRSSVDGRTPLFAAVRANKCRVVKLLLDFDADIDAREIESGKTALDLALALKRRNVVELLLQYGATSSSSRHEQRGCLLM